MMKGFSLLEFLCAMTLFLFVLIYGYSTFDLETKVINDMTKLCRPEQESNYRLLVLKNLLQNAHEGFQRDWRLAAVPIFFRDLNFGKENRPDAFSIAHSSGRPVDFLLQDGWLETAAAIPLTQGDLIVLAGVDASGDFQWNYARISDVQASNQLKVNYLLNQPPLYSGSLMKVQITGFLYSNHSLYAVSSAGQNQPFFSRLDTFNYSWNPPQLLFTWQVGAIKSGFRVTL